jgi:hypothetical protein
MLTGMNGICPSLQATERQVGRLGWIDATHYRAGDNVRFWLEYALLYRSPAWALWVGWGQGETPSPCRGTPFAVQSKCCSVPSHPQAAAPGDQLGHWNPDSAPWPTSLASCRVHRRLPPLHCTGCRQSSATGVAIIRWPVTLRRMAPSVCRAGTAEAAISSY